MAGGNKKATLFTAVTVSTAQWRDLLAPVPLQIAPDVTLLDAESILHKLTSQGTLRPSSWENMTLLNSHF